MGELKPSLPLRAAAFDSEMLGKMNVDMESWSKQLHFSNFANAFAQYDDVTSLGAVSRILIIGPGQGLDCAIFRWRDYEVVTFDVDDRLSPDVMGSVHDLSMFADKSFDVVIASHVLEHVPPSYLDTAIAELSRVAHHALIYLPLAGRTASLRLVPGLRGWDWTLAVRLFNPFRKPDPNHPVFCQGQHFWEIGRPGYSRRQIAQRLLRKFQIRKVYRNPDWLVSLNYVLSARE
jgi:predicted SAM-dependent methyltransferase